MNLPIGLSVVAGAAVIIAVYGAVVIETVSLVRWYNRHDWTPMPRRLGGLWYAVGLAVLLGLWFLATLGRGAA